MSQLLTSRPWLDSIYIEQLKLDHEELEHWVIPNFHDQQWSGVVGDTKALLVQRES
jgi:hypothetical protein